jgi:hypothetical protein
VPVSCFCAFYLSLGCFSFLFTPLIYYIPPQLPSSLSPPDLQGCYLILFVMSDSAFTRCLCTEAIQWPRSSRDPHSLSVPKAKSYIPLFWNLNLNSSQSFTAVRFPPCPTHAASVASYS